MSNRTIDFTGRKMILHPSGSIFWPDQATLIVGDLHFEKASWYHSSGQFLPPFDSSETLKKLETVMSEFLPKRLEFIFIFKHADHHLFLFQRRKHNSLP